jgi:hypothetical protein
MHAQSIKNCSFLSQYIINPQTPPLHLLLVVMMMLLRGMGKVHQYMRGHPRFWHTTKQKPGTKKIAVKRDEKSNSLVNRYHFYFTQGGWGSYFW